MQFNAEARKYNDPEKMTAAYLVKYFGNQKIEYPINPFQIGIEEGDTGRKPHNSDKLFCT